MKWFWHALQKTLHSGLSGRGAVLHDRRWQSIYAHEVYEQKEAPLKEIAEFLGIPVEKLRPDHDSLFDSVKKLFVGEVDPVKESGLQRLREVPRRNEEQVAANPCMPRRMARFRRRLGRYDWHMPFGSRACESISRRVILGVLRLLA